MQLRPVLGRFIFDDPVLKEYQETHLSNPRWQMFECTLLEKNHRQGKDKTYAELLNRIDTFITFHPWFSLKAIRRNPIHLLKSAYKSYRRLLFLLFSGKK